MHIYLYHTDLDVVEIRQPEKRRRQDGPGWELVVRDGVGEEEEGDEEHGGERVGLWLCFCDVCGCVCVFGV
jgi:hypothetical protein